jgi:hypothetical protein
MSKIILLGEGETEKKLGQILKRFLDQKTSTGNAIGLQSRPIARTLDRLKFQVKTELKHPEVMGVIALLDVYPDFTSATEVKKYLQKASNDPRYFPHAAPYEIEAWLLPYWEKICARLKQPKLQPLGRHPEKVNGENPPSHRLDALYQKYLRRGYSKPIELQAILGGVDLEYAAKQCPELKALLNTLCKLAGVPLLP